MTAPVAPAERALVRGIGRWDLVAAVVNSVIGSAIFGLPSAIAALTGALSPLVVLVAAAAILPIVLCFAEMGSRFDVAGGPYLYAREAFGATAGFHVGWLLMWSRLFSAGAILNVLVTYLAPLAPWVGTTTGRATTMVATVAVVTAVNLVGVRQAAWAGNAFAVAKLLPIALVIALGLTHLRGDVLAAQHVARPDWTEALLLLVFAYGGFEAAVIVGSETRRPRTDTAFALLVAMGLVAAIYALVQLAIVGTLPAAATSKAPIADALRVLLGAPGGVVAGVAAVLSAYGWLTAFMLLMPRVLFSMAERGELPTPFARVHPTFRTPHVAIVANSLVALGLGLYGTFTTTATLSAIGRLVVFGATCGSLVVLRRRAGRSPGFVAPGGPWLAAFGIAFTLWLLVTRPLSQAWIVGAVIVLGAVVHVAARRAHPTRPGERRR